MDIPFLRTNKLLLLDCISGSKAYGLDTPQSDTDLKGVFLLPKRQYYGLNYVDQVNNATNDEVYYELKRFVDLLAKNNPNILELLNTPSDCVIYRHPVMDLLKPELFLSKLCKQAFAGYAQTQIKKAKGLNKKIVNPIDKERKSVLDFCSVVYGQGSIPLASWLEMMNYHQQECGLVKINHMRDVYAVYHKSQLKEGFLRGICSGTEANDISLSSVEKGIQPLAVLSYNKDGYSSYCKDYKEYWDWVEKRNEIRYENTLDHGKNYDAKNMMHTFRLLNMAEEIAREGKIIVRRPDRDYLLKIRSGLFSYEELVERANEQISRIDACYETSKLPDFPNISGIEEILVEIRGTLYGEA
ncbi:MAG: nucleotidyltransferase domain-containing protein [Bacteroidetes bacterium]|nr:nucleotidyltransferase domain-containing protein [Bacteroidota bacterium]